MAKQVKDTEDAEDDEQIKDAEIQLTDKDNMKLLVQDSSNKKELLFLSF